MIEREDNLTSEQEELERLQEDDGDICTMFCPEGDPADDVEDCCGLKGICRNDEDKSQNKPLTFICFGSRLEV